MLPYIAYMDPMGMVSHGFPTVFQVFPWFSKFSDGFPRVFRGFSKGSMTFNDLK